MRCFFNNPDKQKNYHTQNKSYKYMSSEIYNVRHLDIPN